MSIKGLAQTLAAKYGTRDPFRIAEAMDYLVIFTPLSGVRGFYQYLQRCHVIYIDSGLEEEDARRVCAHELGHSVLHRGLNRLFMDTRTIMVTSRYEKEANYFAADLLFDDYDLQDFLSVSLPDAARCLGLSEDVTAYRLSSVQPVLMPFY